MPADPNRVQAVFLAAVERPDAAARAAFLDRECGSDAALRERVERLLAAHQEDSFLGTPAGEAVPAVGDASGTVSWPGGDAATGTFGPDAHRPNSLATGDFGPDGATGTFGNSPTRRERSPATTSGAVIAGRYTLVEVIGEGGMGSVYLATQSEPVKRQVAVKLIKAGMDSKAVLARFDAERQALALMDHPNIARIYDGGVTPAGQPFFVMELVQGVPLTDYCDAKRLTLDARLELFVAVCQAVQHAHQKGIIHRDLKPGNVLVTEVDGRPTPKVIDFGVAKATEQKLTDMSFSDTGAIVGTPAYMSPEQADPSSMDIDTRTDVYALGVMLYELLTGSPPIDGTQFKRGAILEMLRMVREVEPPRPSTRLSADDALPNIAANRNVEPAKLSKLLQGELDWVVMKALEKDRTRRYETATGLARDLQRYLADEVVEARPPSRGYRLRKFVRRHKGQVIAAGLVVLALVGGVIGTSIGLVQARRANAALADKNAELAEEQAKVQARFELAQQAIATFHTGVSEDALLKNAQFKELRTKLLKEAAGFYGDLEKLLEGQADPKSQRLLAAGYFQLGDLTRSIGDQPAALAVHRKALVLRQELATQPGADAETRLDVARDLWAVSRLLAATGQWAEAVRTLEEVHAAALALEPESPTGEALELAAKASRGLGYLLQEKMGRPAEAQPHLDKALTAYQKVTDAHPTNAQFRAGLAHTHLNIGNLLIATGRPVEALEAHQRALDIRQKLADENPSVVRHQTDLAWSVSNVGHLQLQLSRPAEGVASHRKALAIWQKLADAQPAVNHLQNDLAVGHDSYGFLLARTGRPEAALEEYEKALAIQQRLADANPTVTDYQKRLARTLIRLGEQLSLLGRPTESIAAHDRSVAVMRKLSDSNPAVAEYQVELSNAESSMAWQLFLTGRPADGVAMYLMARDRLQKLVDASPGVAQHQPELGWVHNNFGFRLARIGRTAEALAEYEKNLAIRRKLIDAHPKVPEYRADLATGLNNLGRLHSIEGRFAEAFAALDAGLAIRQELVDANPVITTYARNLGYSYAYRGWARVRAGQPKEAAADLRKAHELFAQDKIPDLETRFERSRALALLAGLGGDAKSGVTKDEAKAFADQSVATLVDTIKAGWANLVELTEPDFDAVRGRDDFSQLVAELQKRFPPPKEVAPPREKK